jgi:hypothetical protein
MNGSQGGRSAIPVSACDVWFHSTSPRISFSSSRSLRN